MNSRTTSFYSIKSNSSSSPDLRISFDEFMYFWNSENNKNNKKEVLWPNKIVKSMFFCRSNSDKQQNNKSHKRMGKQSTTSSLSQQKANSSTNLNNLNNSSQRYSFGPLVSLRHQAHVRSPFVPLPFERPLARQNFRDDDLLPSCWFLSDSEINDLNQRAHYKLQRRISRRRSLTRANFPFGETNPRRAKVVEKYHRLKVGVRRALSDHQILFMDPIKDVECELNSIFNLNSRRTNNHKRVSFSSPSSVCASSITNEKEETNWNNNKEKQKQQKNIQSVKPILTRRNSVKSNRNTAAITHFRSRVGTSLSVGGCFDDENDYSVMMDFAMFRAWRRGSRLSVDVLSRAALCSASFDGAIGRNSQTEQRIPGWALVLKRVLADWIKRRKRSSDETVVTAVEEEVEKEQQIEDDNNSSIKMTI
ncbi:hypothetical protein ACQ4LE_009391 [Meloidogyne hapla]|uniref:Uncharacterized protein n=1 Tax=Meloidogyne hapla TaxID=6305 RepID=A0A1I8BBQ7_MELHA